MVASFSPATASFQRLLLVWAATSTLVVHTSTAFTTSSRQQPFRHHTSQNHAFRNSAVSSVSRLYAMNDKDALSSSSATASSDSTVDTVAFDKALQDGKLRQAVQYLQDHPDMPVNRQRFNDIFAAIEERTAVADEAAMEASKKQFMESGGQNQKIAEFPMQSAARQEMTDMYGTLQKLSKLQLFGAVNTNIPPAAGSTLIPPPLLEQITALPMKALTPKPTQTLLIAGIAVAAGEAWLSQSAGIPLDVLALSTLFLALTDRIAFNGAVSETLLKVLSPGMNQKVVRHEAGHFLAAYLLGCPVEGIVLSAWAALQDRRFGQRQVSAGTSFFDAELSQQINTNGAVTRSSIDRYSVIVMAGIAAEADFYGRADGGAGDEMALVAFLSQLNANTRTGAVSWDQERIRNQARWGALQAVLMMREYKPAYDALVDALERGGSLGDCVYAIEKAAREHDLKPLQQPVGYIVDGPADNGVLDGSGSTWTTVDPGVTGVAVGGVDEKKQLEQQLATLAVKVDQPKAAFNGEESMATLKGYRTIMEDRLKELDEKLKDIED
jgi:hypothetical protein